MTAQKHLKQLVRERMQKTGESYTSARRHLVGARTPTTADPKVQFHFPGSVPATTVARTLLSQAGLRIPQTGNPLTEAMVFGIAGGIGIGIFQFLYEKDDFASFFIGGRHQWQDDRAYLEDLCARCGAQTEVSEFTGAAKAQSHLAELLRRGPAALWVDAANLPHRGMPDWCSGGAYHIVTAYSVEPDDTVRIGDLADDPISVSLTDLATARSRIKSQKRRVLAITGAPATFDLAAAVREGIRAFVQGLIEPGWKGYRTNFSLASLQQWAKRMRGGKGADSWDHVFPLGGRFWTGLTSINEYIEHYGTGGGLCRPLFAEFLLEAGAALGDARLSEMSQAYSEIGGKWSELAAAALPEGVPVFRQTRDLHAARAAAILEGASPEAVREHWRRLGELKAEAAACFPLSDAQCMELRSHLAVRVEELYLMETAALETVKVWLT